MSLAILFGIAALVKRTTIYTITNKRVVMRFGIALPITFLALIAPMLRTPAHVVAALVSIVVSLLAAWVPYSLGLIIAGFVAMIAGARTEVFLERRKGSK